MWIITRDYISRPGEKNYVGTCSRNYTEEKARKVKMYKFRIKDSDGTTYYDGLSDDDSSFDPLDDFASPNDGASSIFYMVKGKWQEL